MPVHARASVRVCDMAAPLISILLVYRAEWAAPVALNSGRGLVPATVSVGKSGHLEI